jgi:long-chain acyl-CoA synthetase
VLERRPAAAGAAVDAEPETPAEERLYALIRAVKDAPAIHRAMNLELDLGFTSLERVELFSGIPEAFGTGIPEAAASKIHTVAELLNAVERIGSAGDGGVDEARVTWSAILKAPLDAQEARIADQVLRPRPGLELLQFTLARLLRLVFGVLLRFRVDGIEALPRPPFVISPNHVSFLDAFLVLSALPYRISPRVFFLGEAAYFRGGLMGRVARWGKVVTLSPDRAVRSSLRLAVEGLQRGMVLCVFPEGERSIDGRPKPFRKGPAIVATESGVPVVPVGIRGAWEVWPRGSNRIRPHPVSISFGAPLDPSGKSADAFNEELRDAVARLL